MKKTILLLIVFSITFTLSAQVSKTVNVTTGGLSTLLTPTEKSSITHLTLTGAIDARDFKTLRDEFPELSVLDLSGTIIISYTGDEGPMGSENINYPANEIPEEAFYNDLIREQECFLSTIVLPSTLQSIGKFAFFVCRYLKNVTIPPTVTSIGKYAFDGCLRLNTIDIPNSVNYIGDGAFMSCGLLSITIPSSIDTLYGYTFAYCDRLRTINLPQGLEVIKEEVFSGCDSVMSLTLPNSVTFIGGYSFCYNKEMESLTIPSSVKNIMNNAFYNCTNLKSIYANAPVPVDLSRSSEVFKGINKSICTLYVPAGSKSLYQAAEQWKDFTQIVETGTNNSISNVRKISQTQGGFTGQLHSGDQFGIVKAIGDVDGDGIEDMAVGAPWDDDGGTNWGAVWILFMNHNGTIKKQQKISAIAGNFNNLLSNESYFGRSITSLGDFNNDNIPDIAVGAWGAVDADVKSGAVWIILLKNDGTVLTSQKISANQGGLVGLTANRQFGYGVTSLGDLDEDGITDIAVGSPTYDNDGGLYRGCVWVLFLNQDGTVKSQQKINDYQGGFTGILDDEDRFGLSLENIGDINKDDIIDIAVQAYNDDDGGTNTGAIYILFLNKNGTVKQNQKISVLQGNFKGKINPSDLFGIGISNLGDVDGDGTNDILTSSYLSDDCGTDRGKVWILYMNTNGSVKNYYEIDCSSPSLTEHIDNADYIGISVSCFNGHSVDGKKQLLIGAIGDDDGYSNAGAVYILDLGVAEFLTLSKTSINFPYTMSIDNVEITSNVNWSASSDKSWLTVSPISGTLAGKLNITASQNTSPETRKATITVAGQGIESKTIIVSQESDTSTNFYFTIDPSTISILGSNGSKGTFNVSSTTPWTVSTNQTWLKISPKIGTGNKTVTVTSVGANPSTSPRTGFVTVSAEGFASQKVTVIQASGDTTLSVTNNIVNIGYAEGSSAWTGITSNTTWNASADQSWLTITPQNGDGNRNLVFVASENPLTTVRTATVTVSAIGATAQTITVIQAAKPGITIATDTIYIGREEGSTAQLPVSANVSWRAVQDETWLSVNPGSGIGDTVITFTATANPTVAERASVVSISGINIGVTRVTVIQEAALPMLSIEGEGYILPNEGGSITDVALTANMNWNASSDQTWLTVSPLTGFGNNVLTFSAGENLSLEQRVAYVSVTGQGVESVTVKVIQEAGVPVLSIKDEGFIFPKEGGSITDIILSSNMNWNASSNQPWLTVSPLLGIGNKTLTFSASENPFLEQREGYITISCHGVEPVRLKVIQEGGEPFFDLLADEIHLGYEQGSTATIDVVSNSQWTISNMESWLIADQIVGVGDAVVTFTAQANPSLMDRPGNITFKPNGKEAQTILAIQLAKPVSAETIAAGGKYILYPNPVSEGFLIKGIEGEARVTITDLTGRVCLRQTIEANTEIHAGKLAKGVYIVTIADGGEKIEKKLVKE